MSSSPLSELTELNVKPEDIGKAYDQITHLWEQDTFNKNNGIEAHRRAIAFTDNRGKALDVGCGCSDRIINLLSEHGFEPEGIDVSNQMLAIKRSVSSIDSAGCKPSSTEYMSTGNR